MNSKKQKILHEVGGKPMVMHVFETAEKLADSLPIVVVGPGETGVRELIGNCARYIVQPKPMGTGHAVMVCYAAFPGWQEATQLAVTYGDMPMLREESLRKLAQKQAETGAAVVMLSVMGDPASTFGRVLRDENGRVCEIIEVAEARQRPNPNKLLAIPEQNAGVYCFDAPWLWENINQLPLRQARRGQEYYLTDLIALAVAQNRLVEAIVTDDPDERLGAGTRQELVEVEKAFRRRVNNHWLANGVTLIDPTTTYIDPDVTIGRDTVIWPNSYLQGKTIIGEDCIIGPNTILRHAQLGDGCRVEQAVVENTAVPSHTTVLPCSYLKG